MSTLAVPSKPLSPDEYKNYALQDPGFIGLQSALKGNEDAYKANARGGINRGVMALGIAPPDSSLNGWLDPGTAAAAAANPLSANAGLTEQHHQNLRSIQNQLAARGAYDSGELPYNLGNENTRDNTARSDALAKFMDYANGLFGNLGSMQASDAGQLGQELGAAAMRQLALHPGSTTAATWNDSTGTYVDGDGNHYDQYGNHIGTGGDQTTNFGGPPITQVNGVTFAGGIPTNAPSNDVATQQATNAAMEAWNQQQAGYRPPDQPVLTQGGGGPNIRSF